MKHEPVLCQQITDFLRPPAGSGWIVDATLGLGGHSEALLERYEAIRLLGIDRDPEAIRRASERLARFGDRFVAREGRHESLFDILNSLEIDTISGLVADLGVSSMQLDDPARGFSFRFDAPLDMRMGSGGQTAAELLAEIDEKELADILWKWGEESQSRRIAAAIVRERDVEPIETTGRLADIVRSVKHTKKPSRIDPATLDIPGAADRGQRGARGARTVHRINDRSSRDRGTNGSDLVPFARGQDRQAYVQEARRRVHLSAMGSSLRLRRGSQRQSADEATGQCPMRRRWKETRDREASRLRIAEKVPESLV